MVFTFVFLYVKMYAVEDGIYHNPFLKLIQIFLEKRISLRRFCNKWLKKYNLWRLYCVTRTSL